MSNNNSKSEMKRQNALRGKEMGDGVFEKPPRGFWIVGIREGAVACSAVLDKRQLEKYATDDEDDTVHVIEFAAFAELQSKCAELEVELADLQRMSDGQSKQYHQLRSEVDRLRAALEIFKELCYQFEGHAIHSRGNCEYGKPCECGLTKIRGEFKEALARQALELKGGGG